MVEEENSTGVQVADWDRVAEVYRQCQNCLRDDSHYLPPALSGFLAELLSRLSSSYHQREEEIIHDAFKVFNSVEETELSFADLYGDARYRELPAYAISQREGSRRRPAPFEAVTETARRLRDLCSFETALADLSIGALLGGSASYGRFFNVIGNVSGRASDVDLLIVIEDYEGLPDLLSGLRRIPGASPLSLDSIARRIGYFLEHGLAEKPTVFSAKLGMWTEQEDKTLDELGLSSSYEASLHIASSEVFNRLILKAFPKIDKTAIGGSAKIRDFREAEPARHDHQRSFSGENVRLELDYSEEDEWYIRNSHIFHITEEDAYCPGMFQNLILPAFDILWGNGGFRRRVQTFRWKMVERLRFERQVRPNQFLRLSLSHTRSAVFAPHTIRSVDSSTLVP